MGEYFVGIKLSKNINLTLFNVLAIISKLYSIKLILILFHAFNFGF